MSLVPLPPLSHQLIEALDKTYPALCIRPGETLEEAHRYAGKRELVESLIDLLQSTDTAVLGK